MINLCEGNILDSKMQTLVNTVNCVGVMGKGIALDFKHSFPAMFRDYSRRCKEGKVELGQPYLYRELTGPWILNFPTKGHWRSSSKITDIIDGLDYLDEHYKAWGIDSIAMPALGCGNGGLDWGDVGPILFSRLNRWDIPVEIYAPLGSRMKNLQISMAN